MREEPINNTVDSAQGILNDVEKRIEALSIYINYMYTHAKLTLQGIKRRVKDVKENTCETKSNKSEVSLEAALKLLKSIKKEEQCIVRLEKEIEGIKKRNREMVNRTKERLNLMYERIELLSSGQISVRGAKVEDQAVESIRGKIGKIKGDIDNILLDPYELKLTGPQVYSLPIEIDFIERDIKHQITGVLEKKLSEMEGRRNGLLLHYAYSPGTNDEERAEEILNRIKLIEKTIQSMGGLSWKRLMQSREIMDILNCDIDNIGRDIKEMEARFRKKLILFIPMLTAFCALMLYGLLEIMAASLSTTMEIQI